ncbi:MAG: tRNA (guanosine(37)-N1)-methyltransferase TrmD [Treponema sp.]|jgi:tRNA (guanine37-N1)-methyltransferase|nr:tRNA (guanosine(37)-N1)-methyltransferase TrmD [Treponema sp.]
MKYTILTLFPEIIEVFFNSSIMARAVNRDIIQYRLINIRDYAYDRHKTCDDATYGGGPGMLMLPEPLGRALEAAGVRNRLAGGGTAGAAGFSAGGRTAADRDTAGMAPARVICLSPSGRPFTQALAGELAEEKELVLICGRYEGIDQRIIDCYVDEEISIGDYVLSSGEAAALVVIDATCRLVDRVIRAESLEEESFSGGLLEYPQYTRPELYATLKVPDVLLSGHHERIRRWRVEKRVEKTLALRPDLVRQGEEAGLFDAETIKIIEEMRNERNKSH